MIVYESCLWEPDHELELGVQDFNLAGVEGCGQEEPSDRRPDLSSVKREVRSWTKVEICHILICPKEFWSKITY